MKTVLATVGLLVLILWTLGSLGVGNFVLIYGPDKLTFSKEVL